MVSSNIRAALRNLWINALVAATILIVFYFTNFFRLTTLTPTIGNILYWAVIAGIVAWVLFLLHCCGELYLELQKGNYPFLWSFLPFVLPVVCLLAHSVILGWLPWPFV